MIDLLSQEILHNPYPVFNELRETNSVCPIKPGNLWAVSRFEDVQYALKNHGLFTATKRMDLLKPKWLREECHRDMFLITRDPPDYNKYRKFISTPFQSNAVRKFRPLMESVAQSLCRDIAMRPTLEFFEEFAYPYIGQIICRILGLEGSQSIDDIREFIQAVEVVGHDTPCPSAITRWEKAVIKQNAYFDNLIAKNRQTSENNVVTHLLKVNNDGCPLSNSEITNALDLLIRAGFMSSVHLMGNAMVQLSRRPDLHQKLAQHTELIPAFVDEMLRLYSSVPLVVRHTTQPVTLQGVTIPQGTEVALLLAAANRDPRKFSNPDEFDLQRPLEQHMAFGYGPHICLGLALSRMEVEVALGYLIPSVKSISCPSQNELAWINSTLVRGLSTLPLSLTYQ